MNRFDHGGDIYGHPNVIDFSASLNPLGMPKAAQRALAESVAQFEAYPDPQCRTLRAALAEYENVPVEQVLCCAGATDAIERVCAVLAPKRALVLAPCYSGYEQALAHTGVHGARINQHFPNETRHRRTPSVGAPPERASDLQQRALGERPYGGSVATAHSPYLRYHHLRADEGFAVDDALIDDVRDVDIVFIANPNNPTGVTVARPLLERIVVEAARTNTTVVIDECFRAFTNEPSMANLLGQFPNLVIVSALTKTHALAGVRVGHLMSGNRSFLDAAAQAGQEWGVSTPAQIAGVAALQDDTYLARTRAYVSEARARLSSRLESFGFQVVPSAANYVLVRSETPLYEPLLKRGFLVRNCENFIGLDEHWARIAVRTMAENDALVEALSECVCPG